jgi:sporulation protein YlmC with PRC-barrel domain
VDLVHDLLDKQLIDKNGKPLGRVDGVVLELREGEPPRVAHVEVGGTVLARRLHPKLARWAAAIRRRWGRRDPTPTRIPWSALRRRGTVWEADVDGRDTPAMEWELWLRERVIARVPGKGK